MAYVFFVFLLFCFSVMAHIFFCRRRRNSGIQAKAYLYIVGFFMVVYITGAHFMSGVLDSHSLWGSPFKITAGILFVLLIPFYLNFYTLTQLMSPSKKILICISRKGSASYEEILTSIREEEFINTRLSDLITSGCVIKSEGRYVLSHSGRGIAGILNIMQSVLGRDMGG